MSADDQDKTRTTGQLIAIGKLQQEQMRKLLEEYRADKKKKNKIMLTLQPKDVGCRSKTDLDKNDSEILSLIPLPETGQ